MVDISGRKSTEYALRESEQRFRDLVSGIDVIVWEADPDLNFTFVSKRAEDILGFPVEEWLSDTAFIAAHFHPDDRERVVSADKAAIARAEDYELEYRVIAADGKTVWFREYVSVELDGDGRPARLRGVMVDITARSAPRMCEPGSSSSCGSRRRWSRWAASQAGSPTTSTTS
jgi:PAS domain S-box-containing protein